ERAGVIEPGGRRRLGAGRPRGAPGPRRRAQLLGPQLGGHDLHLQEPGPDLASQPTAGQRRGADVLVVTGSRSVVTLGPRCSGKTGQGQPASASRSVACAGPGEGAAVAVCGLASWSGSGRGPGSAWRPGWITRSDARWAWAAAETTSFLSSRRARSQDAI